MTMEVSRVACVGAGLIGQGWATLFSAKGFEVTLQDTATSILERSLAAIESNLRFLAENDLLNPGKADAALARIKTTTNITEAVDQTDYVQESVPDDYEVKRQVFREMDAAAAPHAILASSASGLLMTRIQDVTTRPERCVLVHPILPVHLIPLVEIAGGQQTSANTVKRTADLMSSLGKKTVVLKREVPGYIVNRLQAALLREAIDLVAKGVASAEDIDRAFCAGIGLRDPLIGPFLRIHLAGNGIERFFDQYGPSYQYRWETMETWTSIPPTVAEAVIHSVNEMRSVRARTMGEIKRWRDKMLVKLLGIIHEGGGPAGVD